MIGIVVYVLYFIFHSQAEKTICINNLTGSEECCVDYQRRNSDTCKPCIGYFGKNCSTPCYFGFYGHGCREVCSCSSATHWCDPKSGCIKKKKSQYNQTCNQEGDNNTTCNISNAWGCYMLVLTAAGSILVTSAVWIISCLVCKWCRGQNVNGSRNRNMEEPEDDGDSSRESRCIGPENLPPTTSSNQAVKSVVLSKSLKATKSRRNSRNKLRRSHSLFGYKNGHSYRYSDDYNHLDFHKKSTLSPKLVTNSNYNKINLIASPRYENTSHEEHEEENSYVSLVVNETSLDSESEIMQERQKTSNNRRAYNSVKVNREIRINKEQTGANLSMSSDFDEACSNTIDNLIIGNGVSHSENIDDMYREIRINKEQTGANLSMSSDGDEACSNTSDNLIIRNGVSQSENMN